ncbi:MAG: protein BatD [Desulfobacterales bacterium]|nr:protein BatD [Desulfobacterales bacterium]
MVFKTKTLLIVLAWSLLALSPAWAGDVSVRAQVDRTRIANGEPFRLSVTLQGGPGTVDLSGLSDFDVASRGSSTNIQLINGRLSKEIRYDYGLIPKKTGRLTIPALPVETDNGVLHTPPIAVEVTDQPQTADDSADVFVQAEISTPAPYAGQQLIYRFRFFNAVQVADNVRFQKPDFTGFTVRKVEKERVFQQTVSGRTYQVTELAFVIIPLESGSATIDPAVIQCQVFQKGARQDPLSRLSPFFDDRFFARHQTVPRTLRTPALPVTVRPLPPVPADMPFSGLVGRFDIKAEIDRPEVPAGESVTLTVTVAGEGNVMDAPAPELGPISDAKVYADTPEEELSITDQGISGEKRFRFAVVPVLAGDLNLPAMELGFFDPSAGRYRRAKSRPIHVRVLAAAAGNEPAMAAPPPASNELPAVRKKPVTFSGRDILPLKDSLDAIEDAPAMTLLAFVLWMTGPALIYLLIAAVLARMGRTESDRQKMARQAREQIRQATEPTLTDADYLSALYTALVSAIYSAGDKLGGALTGADARRWLVEAGHADEEIVSVIQLLERIEAARFGGKTLGVDERKSLLEETQERVGGLCR